MTAQKPRSKLPYRILISAQLAALWSFLAPSSSLSLFIWNQARRFKTSTEPTLSPAYHEEHNKELRDWIGNATMDPFYISPENWEKHSPGDILRVEKANGLEYTMVPSGLSIYRLLYVSMDHNEKPVPASAFVLFPFTRKKLDKDLDVIVWAHGTSGIERHCTPSNNRELFYEFGAPIAMALRGYAVIGPDYAGLGSNTTFHYCSSFGHAADMSYAVTAARAAFPTRPFTQKWVAVGHSEGASAAWAVNEREAVKPTGGFRGSVAIAPSLQPVLLLRQKLARYPHSGMFTLFYSYILSAIGRFDQSVNVTQYFSEIGMERTRLAETSCYMASLQLFSNLTFSDMFKDPSWIHSDWATSWDRQTGITGDNPLAEPILVIQGSADMGVYPDTTKEIFDQHCKNQPQSRGELYLYPNMDHESVMFVSQPDMFEWIEDRFNGKHLSGCSTNVILPISMELDTASMNE